jgi:hypothetical protein
MYKKLALLALLLLMATSPVSAGDITDLTYTPTGYFVSESVTTGPLSGIKMSNAVYTTGINYLLNVGTTDAMPLYLHLADGSVLPNTVEVCQVNYAGGSITDPTTGCSNCTGVLYKTGATTAVFNATPLIAKYPNVYYVYIASNSGDYTWRVGGAAPVAPVNVIFTATESGNFTHKLEGVTVTSSSGVSGSTNVNGSVTLSINPAASTYTYIAHKVGYADVSGVIGSTGTTGGEIYFSMIPGAGTGSLTTVIHAIDSNTGSHIYGAQINAICVSNLTWTNRTTSDGKSSVVCAATDILDVYGSALGYSNAFSYGVTQGGDFYLPLIQTGSAAPIGYVKIYVTVKDNDTGNFLQFATITATQGETTDSDSSGASGTTYFTVPNNTVIILSASKPGYTSMSKSLLSGAGATLTTEIKLSKTATPTQTVQPFVTDPATGLPIIDPNTGLPVTVAPVETYLPYCDPNSADYSSEGCSKSQDSSFMAKLRENAPFILDLAIYGIIFWLIASMFGAIKSILSR